jgi:hypothetical protein
MKMRLSSTGGVRARQLTGGLVIAMALWGFPGFGQVAKAQTGFGLGDAANYAIMDEGYGTNNLGMSGQTIDGSIGIGCFTGTTTTKLELSGDTITGNIDFAGAIDNSGASSNTINGAINGTNIQVQADLNYLNNLSATLGDETGSALTISPGSNITIHAGSGKLDASGNYVFNVTAFNGSGSTITIDGDGLGHNVVINFTTPGLNPDFSGSTIVLTGGLTTGAVLFNIADSDTLTLGGKITGTFLDPNGVIIGTADTLNGHVYGGGDPTSPGDIETIINVPLVGAAG